MNILFVTGHPAQIHNFKLVKKELEEKGHNVFWLATEKDISKYLLKKYNIKFTRLNKPGKNIFSKVYYLVKNTIICSKFIRKNKINIIISSLSLCCNIRIYVEKKTFCSCGY